MLKNKWEMKKVDEKFGGFKKMTYLCKRNQKW